MLDSADVLWSELSRNNISEGRRWIDLLNQLTVFLSWANIAVDVLDF